MIPRLGVNIDHVATLRQARGEAYPSVVEAAKASLGHGADQITLHLREDRRHIQDIDVEAVHLVTKKFGKPLNFEMGTADEIIEIAIATEPEWICLVPEKREEQTTEGGLNLLDQQVYHRTEAAIAKFRKAIPKTKISLFLEANEPILEKAHALEIEAVEIHTGDYARAFLTGDSPEDFLESFSRARDYLQEKGIGCHAGHGLTRESVVPLLKAALFEEYNIGHWIICQAVFQGLPQVVTELKEQMNQYPVHGGQS